MNRAIPLGNGAVRQALRVVVVRPIDFCPALMLDCTFDLEEEVCGAATAHSFDYSKQ